LSKFEEIVPGSAKLFFLQYEAQTAHRRKMESSAMASAALSQRLGAVSASFIGVLAVAGGLWLVHEGKSLEGLSAVFATLSALVGTFVYKSRQQAAELREKRSAAKRS
jgi:hypothetical protein